MTKIVYSLMFVLIIIGGVFTWQYRSSLEDAFHWMHNNDRIKGFEIEYTPADIIKINNQKIVRDSKSLDDPTLTFFPYLAMKVDYSGDEGDKEKGILLWSLTDGEAVVNADTWEMTNGFSKAIEHKATTDDLNLLQIISRNGGSITKEALQRRLHLDDDQLNQVVDKAINHHLIVDHEGHYRLANEQARIDISPQTHFSTPFKTKTYVHVIKQNPKYTKEQVQEIALAAFGHSFSIDQAEEIYLPVYVIEGRNPQNGSKLKTYWNAINGKKFLLPSQQEAG